MGGKDWFAGTKFEAKTGWFPLPSPTDATDEEICDQLLAFPDLFAEAEDLATLVANKELHPPIRARAFLALRTHLPEARVALLRMRITRDEHACLVFSCLNTAFSVGADVLRSMKLESVNLSGADLSRLDLHDLKIRGSILVDADLTASRMERASLNSSNLHNAVLRRGVLQEARLKHADLSDADLSDADLSHADLSGATLSGANFSNTNMNSAIMSGVRLGCVPLRGYPDFRGAIDLSFCDPSLLVDEASINTMLDHRNNDNHSLLRAIASIGAPHLRLNLIEQVVTALNGLESRGIGVMHLRANFLDVWEPAYAGSPTCSEWHRRLTAAL